MYVVQLGAWWQKPGALVVQCVLEMIACSCSVEVEAYERMSFSHDSFTGQQWGSGCKGVASLLCNHASSVWQYGGHTPVVRR